MSDPIIQKAVETATHQAYDNWAKVHPSLAAVINRIVLVEKTAQSLRQSPQYQQAIEAYQQSRNEVNLLNRLMELAGPVLNTFLKL